MRDSLLRWLPWFWILFSIYLCIICLRFFDCKIIIDFFYLQYRKVGKLMVENTKKIVGKIDERFGLKYFLLYICNC